MLASIPDLLRLFAVVALGWAAYRDVRTRRVPNELWIPLGALALVTLVWDAAVAVGDPAWRLRVFLVHAVVSVLFVGALAYGFWWFGGFGGADAKAFIVLAFLFPEYPAYALGDLVLPAVHTRLGVFSFTVLTNTVLVAALYPLALLARNALAGRFSKAMFVGVPVAVDEVPERHGRLLENSSGLTRGGLDLDALRMYLRWRDADLTDLRARPDRHRDPASLPENPGDPGDGAMMVDGGTADDPWGAATFLADIDHGAYGTTPDQLREALDVLVARDVVWVSPGIPFIVPMLVGLVVGLTYGDLLFGALRALGVA